MSWRTNRRTKKPFRTYDPDNAPDRIDMAEEQLAPSGQSTKDDSDTFWCEACQANREGQKYVVNGHTICKEDKEAIVSGQIFAPTSPTPSLSVLSSVDPNHTIPPNSGHSCAGCGAGNRNLCPCHECCYNCRPANC